jgi:precorrin-4 methylase
MECIKSLQSTTTRLQTKISSVESVSSEREQEVAASLQDIANCVSEARSERSQLHDLINSR